MSHPVALHQTTKDNETIVAEYAASDQELVQNALSINWQQEAQEAFVDLTKEKTGGINALLAVMTAGTTGPIGGAALLTVGLSSSGATGIAEAVGGAALMISGILASVYTVANSGPNENIISWRKKKNLSRRKARLTKALALTAKAEIDDNGDVVAAIANHGKPAQRIVLGKQDQDVIAGRFINIERFCVQANEQAGVEREQALTAAGVTSEGRLMSEHQRILDDGKTTEAMARSANEQLVRSLNNK